MGRLYEVIQRHMDRTGVTEPEVARRLGMTPQALNLWQHNDRKRLPARETLEAIARVTGIPYEDVLEAGLAEIAYVDLPPGQRRRTLEIHGQPLEVVSGRRSFEITWWDSRSQTLSQLKVRVPEGDDLTDQQIHKALGPLVQGIIQGSDASDVSQRAELQALLAARHGDLEPEERGSDFTSDLLLRGDESGELGGGE